jgi:PAS domain S-box-containing protein
VSSPTLNAERRVPEHVQPPSVLIVDDRPENLLAFEATLEPLGVRIVRANSAAEALEHVLREDFAVIVLDVQMPGMNGYEVARRIKAMAPPRLTPIIFVTALDRDRRQAHTGYESGAVDYLFKPLEPDVLRQKVAAFVRLHKEQEAEKLRQRQRYADLAEQSAHRAAALLERISDAHVLLDRDFRIEAVNAAAERTLGVDRRALLGRDYWEAFPAAAGSEIEHQLRRAKRDRADAHFTHHVVGEEQDLHLEIDAYPTDDGGLAVFSCDVTQRVRAETALRESETRYRTLFESLDEGFCIIELLFDENGRAVDYRFIEANPAFVQQTGLAHAVGRRMRELAPAHEDHWFEIYGRVATTGEPVRFQNSAQALHRHYDVYAFRIGRPEDRHVAVLFNDVTANRAGEMERERLIRQLDVERSRLADVFRQAPVAVAVLRGRSAHDLVYDLVNPRYVEMVPGRQSPVGRRMIEVIPEARDAIYPALQRVLDTGQPFLATDYLVPLDRDGDGVAEEYFFNFVYHPLVEADGAVSGIVDVGTEVTESVRTRREAERLQRVAEQARDEAERAHQRTARLQSLTAALAGTRTVDDVAAVVVAQAVEATGASTGMLTLRDPDVEEATIVRQTGLGAVVPATRQRFPLSAPGTAAHCLRTGEPQWIETREALLAEHPEIARHVGGNLALQAVATVPLLVADQVVGAMSFTFAEPREFPVLEREFFLAVARQTSQAIERARLIDAERSARAQAEAAERRLGFLAEASARLAGSLDVEATLATIAELAVPALADWCFVEALEEGQVRPVAIAHVRPEMVQRVRESLERNPIDLDAPFGTGKVLRTREPELVPEITDETLASVAQDAEHLALLRSAGMRSSITVPLIDARGDAVAALSLVSSDSGHTFGDADLAMAMELARRAGTALANAQLVEAERAARAEAEAASRTKSQFLATMSHELRTPLNAIAGHVQLIEMELHGPVSDAQRDALGRVDRAQRHLLGLINDVLNYARVEAGRVEYDLAPVLVRDVLTDVLPMIEAQVGGKKLALEMRLPERDATDPVHVWADRDKLGQILLNILSNAVKFTAVGGRITVALDGADEAPDEVSVRIADTGVGIPRDKLDAVFEPFVQIRSDYTRQVEGTGLGLAISRDLARGMGGDLRASSELGVGSTFELVLRRVTTVGGAPVERRSRSDRRAKPERRSGEERRQDG